LHRGFMRRFLVGRYGPDQLSVALLIFSLVLGIIGIAARVNVLRYISYAPLVLAFCRLFSRNIYARRRENDRFLRYYSPIKTRVKRKITAFRERGEFKHYSCPSCHSDIRAPRGKGKIAITCRRCGERFVRDTGKPKQ